MSTRRSKVIPGPLLYPEKAPVTANVTAPPPASNNAHGAASDAPALRTAPTVNVGLPRPRLFRVASPSTALPSAAAMSGTEPFSPGVNVYRDGGGAATTASILPKTRVLVNHHVSNTGAVVRLERVDYSKAMRAYRVCRQEGGMRMTSQLPTSSSSSSGSGGTASPSTSTSLMGSAPATSFGGGGGAALPASSPTAAAASASSLSAGLGGGTNGPSLSHNPAPWRVVLLRLFGAADMALLAIFVACFLVVVSRLRLTQQSQNSDGRGSGGGGGLAAPSMPDPFVASTSWIMTLLASVVAPFAPHTGASIASWHDPQPRVGAGGFGTEDKFRSALVSSPEATADAAGAVAATSSYTQATHAASLDTSVTFALLFFSVLLLAKRLSSAVTRVYVEEVLVMRGVGLQFSSYGIFNTLRYKIFIDLKMLRSLVIHDGFFRYQPLFYLSSSVENRAERLVYFPDTLPRLAVLRPVLNGVRGVLYGEPEEGPSLAELEERWKTSLGDISEEELFTEDSFAEDTMTTPDDGRSSDGTDEE